MPNQAVLRFEMEGGLEMLGDTGVRDLMWAGVQGFHIPLSRGVGRYMVG